MLKMLCLGMGLLACGGRANDETRLAEAPTEATPQTTVGALQPAAASGAASTTGSGENSDPDLQGAAHDSRCEPGISRCDGALAAGPGKGVSAVSPGAGVAGGIHTSAVNEAGSKTPLRSPRSLKKHSTYLRLRNTSEMSFDSIRVNGIRFGALERDAESQYRAVDLTGLGPSIEATSSGDTLSSRGIDCIQGNWERQRLSAGYYTYNLTVDTFSYALGAGVLGGRLYMDSHNVPPSVATTAPPAPPRRPPAPVPGPFDAQLAREQLALAAFRASTCGQVGETRGAGEVSLALGPRGRVTSVTHLNHSFDGNAVGLCVLNSFAQVRVSPFQGSPQSLTGAFFVPYSKGSGIKKPFIPE